MARSHEPNMSRNVSWLERNNARIFITGLEEGILQWYSSNDLYSNLIKAINHHNIWHTIMIHPFYDTFINTNINNNM